MNRLKHVLFAFVALIYVINPTAGILELIPDNIPIIGNLDEAGAVMLLLNSLKNLGMNPFGLFTVREAPTASGNRPKEGATGYRPPSLRDDDRKSGSMAVYVVLGLIGFGAVLYWVGQAFSESEPTFETTSLAENDSTLQETPQESPQNELNPERPAPSPSLSPELLAQMKLEAVPAGATVYADTLGIGKAIGALQNDLPIAGRFVSARWATFEAELWIVEKAGTDVYAKASEEGDRLSVIEPVNCRTTPEVSPQTVVGKLQIGSFDLLESKPDEIYGAWHKVKVTGFVRL